MGCNFGSNRGCGCNRCCNCGCGCSNAQRKGCTCLANDVSELIKDLQDAFEALKDANCIRPTTAPGCSNNCCCHNACCCRRHCGCCR